MHTVYTHVHVHVLTLLSQLISLTRTHVHVHTHTHTQCPYHHGETARSSSVICLQWMEWSCLGTDSPYKHPGGREGEER